LHQPDFAIDERFRRLGFVDIRPEYPGCSTTLPLPSVYRRKRLECSFLLVSDSCSVSPSRYRTDRTVPPQLSRRQPRSRSICPLGSRNRIYGNRYTTEEEWYICRTAG